MRYVYNCERDRIDVTGLGSVKAFFQAPKDKGARPEIKIIRRCAFEYVDYSAEDAEIRAQIEDHLNAQLGVPWTAGSWQELVTAINELAEARRRDLEELEIVPQGLFEQERQPRGRKLSSRTYNAARGR